ncbi:MAG: M3 family metallopeptidase [Acidiferrobacter sp.]
MTTPNPLLALDDLPHFSAIRAEHVGPALTAMLATTQTAVEQLLSVPPSPRWEDVVGPLEWHELRVKRFWSPIAHLHAVADSAPLREAYNEGLQRLTRYQTTYAQDRRVYDAYKAVAEGPQFRQLSVARRRVIENALRDLRLAGVALPEAPKARFKTLQEELSALTSRFEQNVLDATDAFTLPVTDSASLSGIPESVRTLARQTAEQAGRDGFLFTLQAPSYVPVMTYADDRTLRRRLYEAYVTRASESGGDGFDNTGVASDILKRRQELAALVGYKTYADYSLATKMADNAGEVLRFLRDLAVRARPAALTELAEIRALAEAAGHPLEAWDVAYYSERFKEQRFQFSEEELRPYFPLPQVLRGLFTLTERLYDVRIVEQADPDSWHPDVRFYEIREPNGEPRGQFYLDLYARSRKRGGAWMDECCVRHITDRGLQLPVAYLTCNFSPPGESHPALLRHDEVETLFHEFGHGLHHMLTRVNEAAVAGINGVPWDAVELPSQFMENFCWEREVIDLIGAHYQTHAPLPPALFRKLRAARSFQAALQMLRQVEFALFDIRLHSDFDPVVDTVHDLLSSVRSEVAVLSPPPFNRFENSFTHIFAGGYAAGYYSYKWAEVLSADAFSRFEENGVFDRDTGLSFLHTILERGGEADPRELFASFRGRPPTIDALLRQNGLLSTGS